MYYIPTNKEYLTYIKKFKLYFEEDKNNLKCLTASPYYTPYKIVLKKDNLDYIKTLFIFNKNTKNNTVTLRNLHTHSSQKYIKESIKYIYTRLLFESLESMLYNYQYDKLTVTTQNPLIKEFLLSFKYEISATMVTDVITASKINTLV